MQILKTKLTKKQIGILVLVILLAAGEMIFDYLEIAAGKLLLATNPLRSKTGRLWVEEKKDIDATKVIDSLTVSLRQDSLFSGFLYSVEDLQANLALRQFMQVTKANFKSFYNQLPNRQAQKLIDPLKFLELDRNKNWHQVNFSYEGNLLGITFLDGFSQPLYERTLPFSDLTERTKTVTGSELDHDPMFSGRIISADIFYEAFQKLSHTYKLQIINNPHRLVQWGDNLRRVGIASQAVGGEVRIAFEVTQGARNQVYFLNGSEIATGYLIDSINRLDKGIKLKFPVRQEKQNE